MTGNPTYKELENKITLLEKKLAQQQHYEKKLRESEARYKLLFDNACPITFFDTDLNIVLANQAASNEIGIPLKKLIGMNKREIHGRLSREQIDFIINREMKVISEGKGGMFIDEVEFEFGKQWYFTNSLPVIDNKGKTAGVVVFAYNITKQKNMEKVLEKSNKELNHTNIALKVMLQKRDEEKIELEEMFLHNIKDLIMPFVDELKTNQSKSRQKQLIDLIENNLNEVTASFASRLSSKYYQFTPTEILIASMIKQGKKSKDIAKTLNVSPKTVTNHRLNIRKKMGINHKKANLKTHLLSLS